MPPRLTMPPRPPQIRPSHFIRLPRYTIPVLLSPRRSSLRGEPIMELRGGFIRHSADVKTSAVKVSESIVSFGPPAVESLIPSLDCSHLLNRARSSNHFGMARSFDVKQPLRWRRLTSRPAQGTGMKARSPRPPSSGSAAMESKDKPFNFHCFCPST